MALRLQTLILEEDYACQKNEESENLCKYIHTILSFASTAFGYRQEKTFVLRLGSRAFPGLDAMTFLMANLQNIYPWNFLALSFRFVYSVSVEKLAL